MSDSTTALATVLPAGGSLVAMQEQHTALRELRQHLLKSGHDYGTINGCGPKPTLLKPGAEKLLQRFCVHTSPADTEVEDLGVGGELRYRVTLGGRTPDGVVRGVGVGEASTMESKYRWRKAVSKAEWEAAPEERRRLKHFPSGSPQLQVRQEPADVANTVLKMAFKRALVALALTATSASEFFTQDLEDLEREQPADPPRRPQQPASPPAEPPPPDHAYKMAFTRARRVEGADDDLIVEIVRAGIESESLPPRTEWTEEHGDKLVELVTAAVHQPCGPSRDAPPPGPEGSTPAGSLADGFIDHPAALAKLAEELGLPPSAVTEAAAALGAPDNPEEWGALTAGNIGDELHRRASHQEPEREPGADDA